LGRLGRDQVGRFGQIAVVLFWTSRDEQTTEATSDTSLDAGGITRMRCSALGGGSLSAGIGDQICLCLAATWMSQNGQWFPQNVVSSPTVFASNGGTKDAQS
jgi:hypothetical protein